MRLAGIHTIEAANAWLPAFITDFNRRFARTPYSLYDTHRPLRESTEELDDIFSRQRSRVLTRSLTIQYDKVVYLIEPNDANNYLIGKPVMVYDYPDGAVSIKHCGQPLTYSVFDKLRNVNQAVIVDNKRLGAVLALAKQSQELRENTGERTRSKKNISRAAQQRSINITLMKEPDTM
jgi:hypothetical protein